MRTNWRRRWVEEDGGVEGGRGGEERVGEKNKKRSIMILRTLKDVSIEDE